MSITTAQLGGRDRLVDGSRQPVLCVELPKSELRVLKIPVRATLGGLLLFVLSATGTPLAQPRTGRVVGTVSGPGGNPLPGCS